MARAIGGICEVVAHLQAARGAERHPRRSLHLAAQEGWRLLAVLLHACVRRRAGFRGHDDGGEIRRGLQRAGGVSVA
eukprot:1518340-Prymnesium_polylepis.2